MEVEDMDVVIKFASSENSFIYNEGVNKGHTLSYSKVNRCLFLSPGAKQLYHNLCEYAYDGKRDCYPSQATLCIQLGISKTTIKEYTNELRNAGLITVTQERVGTPYNYHLVELHTAPALAHSEAVYIAIEPYKGRRWEVAEAIPLYMASSIYQLASTEPVKYQKQINDWFAKYFERLSIENINNHSQEAPVMSIEKRLDLKIPPRSEEIIQSASTEEREVKRKKKCPYAEIPVQDWNTHHFIAYFEDKYLEQMKLPCISSMKERGAFARVLEIYGNNKVTLKDKVDIYLEQDFFMPKGVSGFCSNITQSYIDQFMKTGSFQRNQSKLVPVANSQDEEDELEQMFKARSQQAREESR